ncbi:MAG TPA: glycoside hydrolase family 3 N-terminal domain-containing protein [Burkholderiales bacterium]|nr:glycoside hydrolase family 3 N-terminal domain-containing protein [Burkholderiales bacterium]
MSRIDRLLAAMTLEEKIGQLTMVSAGLTPLGPCLPHDARSEIALGRAGSVLNLWGVERTDDAQRLAKESRLGIPLLISFDVLHGHRTIYPIPLAETATFDPLLWEATAHAAAREAAAEGVDITYAPMLDVSRDPRWGRIAESPGEDPWLCSQVAAAKVRGYQGAPSAFADDRVAATAKHLAGYGASVAGRDYAAIDISERSLHEVYLAPFKAAVAAGVAVIMPAFVSLAGAPMTSNRHLLRHIVREAWGFDGLIISDYQAVAELVTQGVAADMAEAAALALAAGVDIDMVGGAYARGLALALERGLVRSEWIDEAVRRVLALKERLGLFDALRPRHRAADAEPAPTPASRALARDAARRSIVLLKNANSVLPLSATGRRIALIGPLADARLDMLGPWSGAGAAKNAVSILEGLRTALAGSDIGYAKGADIATSDFDDLQAAESAARNADVIVLCVGESAQMSGEAASRARPALPGPQQELAEAMLALGKPLIMVLSSGRPLLVSGLIERADAVLATWFLGCEAGNAIADVLTGRWNPSGRLPVTWPLELGQVPIFFSEGPTGRPPDANNRYSSKYIDLPVEPLFAFGHGLSYTRFIHRNLRLRSHDLAAGDDLVATIDVCNDGDREGEETVFLFTHDVVASVARPLRELKAYAKVQLAAGKSATVTLSVPVAALSFLDASFTPVLEPGEFEVYVGPNASPRALLKSTFRVRGGA